MCSMKWATPASSVDSRREPARTYAAMETDRAPARRAVMTRGPRGSAVRSNIAGMVLDWRDQPGSSELDSGPADLVKLSVGLVGVETEELHLDELRDGLELELARREWRPTVVRRQGRELDDDPLVALDEGVDDELIRPGLELEMLERVDVDADRERREVGRHVRLVDDDPFDPAGPPIDDVAATEIAVADRLLEEGAQEVLDVRAARDEPAIDEELRGRLGRHDPLLGDDAGRDGRSRAVAPTRRM